MSDPKQDTELQNQLSPTKEKLEVLAAGSDESDSESESEENGVIGASCSSDNSATESKNNAGVTNGSITDDTDDDEEEKEETIPVNNGALEPEVDPKKDYLSSDTEESSEVQHEPASSNPNDGVSIKSKMAPTAYDDDDNFDDLLADLPEDNGVASPAAIEASPELEEEEEEPSEDQSKSPSPTRSPSPDQELERTRSPTPERKDSRGSNGSSSFDERASSLSPEPPKVIAAPASKVTSPLSTGSLAPSEPRANPVARIYTDKIVNNVDSDSEEASGKVVRQKPTGDITQIYTQKLANSQESPKPERAKFVRPSRDITQLYTAALHKEDKSPSRVEGLPKRTGDITKLYTGGLGGADGGKAFKGKPNDERTNPTKHNMSTAMDKEGIKEAYMEVMSDGNGIEWATFIFKGNKLEVTAKGSQFNEFKSQFGPDDRGFGYIKIMTGDEMSKRSKFVMVTWVGSNVSVMKKAKMSTDKALVKDIIQNLSVEVQCENANEISEERFKTEVVRAGGANYGTGVRDK